MPLSDLARETPSHLRRRSVTLKRILFGEFHALVYHAFKLDKFATLKEMQFPLKLSQHPAFSFQAAQDQYR